MKIRTYSELISFPTFIERYRYLQLSGAVGKETFGFDRYLNQAFYRSSEWKSVRNQVIVRDNGCDLGIEGYEIQGQVFVHHMNPISPEDIFDYLDLLLNPEYLISTTFHTHNAIHYGNEELLPHDPIIRTQNDTCPWKKTRREI